MKSSKLKIMLFFVCCLLSALWSEAQGAGDTLEEKKEKVIEFVRHQEVASSPAGSVIAFAGEVPPEGWLLCDGEAYHNQQYPELYSVTGMKYTHGSKHGSGSKKLIQAFWNFS